MKIIKNGLIKKVISMLIALCLTVGIVNIPVYAKTTAISPTKTGDGYALQAEYLTPAQAVKKALKSSAKATTKPTVTKTTSTKKSTATKKVSLTSKIISKYTKTGLTTLKTLANKLGLKLKTVYNEFVKIGVTKAQIKKVSSLVLKLMKNGERFTNCAALAVSKYLNISKQLAAVKNLASDISIDVNRFVSSHKNGFTGTYRDAQVKTLQKSGKKKAKEYELKLSDFKSSLKAGQKAIIHVDCFSGQGHAITVVKEKNGKFGVYDINRNNGNKVIYTSSQFDKLMNGTIKNAYYKAFKTRQLYSGMGTNGLAIKYKYQGISIITDSKEISKKVASFELKYSISNKLKKQNIDLINKQLQTKGLSNLAKTWLQEAKKLINKVAKGDYIKEEDVRINKEEFLRKSLTALKEIENAKFSTISLIEHCKKEPYIDYEPTTVFYPLKQVLNNDMTYKIYMTYGSSGLKIINYLSKQFNLSQNAVFEHFKKFKAESIGILLTAANNDLSKITDKDFLNNNKLIKYGYENEKEAIFQLMSDTETIAA